MADEKPIDMGDIYVGGKQVKAPAGVRPQWDDEDPDPAPTRLSGDAKLTSPKGGEAKMDISNPARAEFLPKEHPLEQHFKKSGVRHQLGSKNPVLSDN